MKKPWEYFGLDRDTWHGLHGPGHKACPECHIHYKAAPDKLFLRLYGVCLGCYRPLVEGYNKYWEILEQTWR